MAKQASAVENAKPGVWERVTDFYHDIKLELAKVTWPSKDELKDQTQIVLLMLAITAVIIYAFDWIFAGVVVQLFKLAA